DHVAKGEVLGAFLDWAYSVFGYKPGKAVVVDDLEVHVRSMLEALKKKGIPAIGIYYEVGSTATTPIDEQKLEARLEYLAKNKQWREAI
ncbi:MAG TPA: DUF2608 domain-containing protein, partial [Opitutales bacterium]|nr:DUF2608 domain-containing protein [Opitutales bacterium]